MMRRLGLDADWTLHGTAPGAVADPSGLPAPADSAWMPAVVPGTVAAALGPAAAALGPAAAALGAAAADVDLDDRDWWYRCQLPEAAVPAPGEETTLVLDGLATLADVFVNGRLVLHSESMFAAHRVDVGRLLTGRDDELSICLRALRPYLAQRRRPRARWRTRLVDGSLRFVRTMLLGRAPGFAPGPPVVGPWRPVALEVCRGAVLEAGRVNPRLAADRRSGTLEVTGRLRAVDGASLPQDVEVTVGPGAGGDAVARARLAVAEDDGSFRGQVLVDRPALWWPHTHGDPALYQVTITAGEESLHTARIGFRELRGPDDLEADGLALTINGIEIFARGVVWTPLGLEQPHATAERARPVLERLAGAGLNMVRVPGTAAYESDAFHDLCDELGILVLQDFMFANLDYPESDEAFMAVIADEVRALLARIGDRPSLAALCGGSEVAQQVAMLGLDPALASGPLYGELLPRLIDEAAVQVPYVPSAPWGGELPFRPDAGVANYYGVGAYLRPLDDARRAGVRFATECLAFANVPDEAALEDLALAGGLSPTHPGWKAGVPRDAGAGWDFDDVRDHYLRELFGADPAMLRSVDLERYLELSRAVSGEVMAETFGEWRRDASPCRGALVLWARDLRPGAGWGVLDHRGEPKVALHHLRRALAPVAVWTTDEGLGGVDIHVGNDRPEPLRARLRVSLYDGQDRRVGEASEDVVVDAHGTLRRGLEAMLGHFVDAAWAYRFGPPAQKLIVATLERRDPPDDDPAAALISQAFRFPAGRPQTVASAEALGVDAAPALCDGRPAVRITADRFLYGVRVHAPGHRPVDDAFGIEPGHARVVALEAIEGASAGPSGAIAALNLAGVVRWELGRPADH